MQQKPEFKIGKNVITEFTGGKITGESGLLLFDKYLEISGLKELLGEYYREDRESSIFHEKPEMLYQELIRITAGHPSANIAKFHQHDPIYQQIHPQGVASASTICRWATSVEEADFVNLQGLGEKVVQDYVRLTSPEKIIIDIDTTYDPASSKLEGSAYNDHYETTGFNPLLAFDGITGLPLKFSLRPGNYHCCREADTFLESIIQNLKITDQTPKLFVRGDSGFASPKIYEHCEKHSAIYVIKLKRNSRLFSIAQEWLNQSFNADEQKKLISEGGQPYGGFLYQADSWEKSRRVVVKATFSGETLLPSFQFIVTNDDEKLPQEVFGFYNQRARMENFIEEGKNGFSMDHLSHQKILANKVRFQVFFLAMLFFKLFQLQTMTEIDQNKTVQTIRRQLFIIAAKVVRGGRKIKFKMSSWFPYQNLYQSVFDRIQSLSWKFG